MFLLPFFFLFVIKKKKNILSIVRFVFLFCHSSGFTCLSQLKKRQIVDFMWLRLFKKTKSHTCMRLCFSLCFLCLCFSPLSLEICISTTWVHFSQVYKCFIPLPIYSSRGNPQDSHHFILAASVVLSGLRCGVLLETLHLPEISWQSTH